MVVVEEIGSRIKWARRQQGLTMDQVAILAGVQKSYISKLEASAKVNPTLDCLVRLAKALNVTVGFLLGRGCPPGVDDHSLPSFRRQAFQQAVLSLSLTVKREMDSMPLEERFRAAVDLVCEQFPDQFTRPILAFTLGLTLTELNQILSAEAPVDYRHIDRFCTVTGIDFGFFGSTPVPGLGVAQQDESAFKDLRIGIGGQSQSVVHNVLRLSKRIERIPRSPSDPKFHG